MQVILFVHYKQPEIVELHNTAFVVPLSKYPGDAGHVVPLR
jgi:hypothetical protein